MSAIFRKAAKFGSAAAIMGSTALVAVSVTMAAAQDWNVVGDGDWNVAGNWNPATVPNTTTSAVRFLANGSTGVVDLGAGSFEVGTVEFTGSYRLTNGELGVTTSVSVTQPLTHPFFTDTLDVVLRNNVAISSAADNRSQADISSSVNSVLTLTAAAGTTLTQDGVISDGTGTIGVVVGGGEVALTAVNTYTAGTTVNSGARLVQTGTIGDVTVNTGGALANSGTVGAVVNNGTVATSGQMATLVQNGATSETRVTAGGEIVGASTINGGALINFDKVASVNVAAGASLTNEAGANTGSVTTEGTVTNRGTIANLTQNTNAAAETNNFGTINGSVVDINAGTFRNSGNVNNIDAEANTTIVNSGTADNVENAGAFTNSGQIQLLTQDGAAAATTVNTGTINLLSTINTGSLTNSATVNDVTVAAGASFTNEVTGTAGAVTNEGTVTNRGVLAQLTQNGTAAAETTNFGTINGAVVDINAGTFRNNGTVNNIDAEANTTVSNTGTAANVENAGAFSNSGQIQLLSQDGAAAATTVNTGTINLLSTINTGSLTNSATVNDVTVAGGASFSNEATGTAGAVTTEGMVTNRGTLAQLTQNGTAAAETLNVGTINGALVDINAGTFRNQGTVTNDLDAAAGTTVNFSATGTANDVTNAGAFTNAGTIQALVQDGSAAASTSNSGTINGTSTINTGSLTNSNIVNDVTLATGTSFTNTSTAGNVTNAGTVITSGTILSLTQSGNASAATTNSGTISGASTIDSGNLTNTGSVAAVSVAAGASFDNRAGASAGAVTNSGAVTNEATGTLASLTQSGNAAAITTNAGTINGATVIIDSGLLRNTGTITGTVQNAATVENSGTMAGLTQSAGSTDVKTGGVISGPVAINGGSLISAGDLQSTVTLEAGTSFTNSGTTGAVTNNSATVSSSGAFASLTQSGGTSTIQSGGSVTGSTAINAGTLINRGTLADVTMAGGTTFNNAGTTGAVTNAGDIINVGTLASLSQSGASATTTVRTGGAITGLSDIDGGSLINAGMLGAIDMGVGTVLTQRGTSGAITNAGTAMLSGSTVNGTLSNSGTASLLDSSVTGGITNDGTMTIRGALTTPSLTNNTSALTFRGVTSVSGDVTNNGMLTILNATPTIGGDFVSTAGSIVDMSQDNATSGSLTINGDATLDGVIRVNVDFANRTEANRFEAVSVGNQLNSTNVAFEAYATEPQNFLSGDTTMLTFGQLPGGASIDDVNVTLTPGSSTLFATDAATLFRISREAQGAGGRIFLERFQNPGVTGLASAVVMTQTLLATVVNRPSSAFVTPLADTSEDVCSTGTWARVVGGRADLEGSSSTSAAGSFRSQLEASYGGIQLGMDNGCYDGFYNGWDLSFGGMGGYNRGTTKQPAHPFDINTGRLRYDIVSSVTETDFEQVYAGAYLGFSRGPWSGDVQYRYETTMFDVSNTPNMGFSGLGVADQKYRSEAHTISGSLGYNYILNADQGLVLVPSAGFSISKVSVDDIFFENDPGTGADNAVLSIEDSTRKIAFGSLLLGKQQVLQSGNAALNYFGVVTAYRDFSDPIKTIYTERNAAPGTAPLVAETDNLGTYGEVSLGVNYTKILDGGSALPLRQMDITGRVDSRFSDRLDSWGLTGQIRIQF